MVVDQPSQPSQLVEDFLVVHLSQIQSFGPGEIEAFTQKLALAYARKQVDKTPELSDVVVVSGDPVSVNRIQRRPIWNDVSSVDLRRRDMHKAMTLWPSPTQGGVIHFDIASSQSVKRCQRTEAYGLLFAPQQFFCLSMIVDHRDDLLGKVTYEIQVACARKLHEDLKYMQHRLRDYFHQRPMWEEEIIYRKESGTSSLTTSCTQLIVVYNPSRQSYRIILSRNDGRDSICWDEVRRLLEQTDELSEYVKKSHAWTVECVDWFQLNSSRHSWSELMGRGVKQQFKSSGGSMISRHGETSSKAWIDDLDTFIDVLQARKRLQETDAEHKRAKIAILDTGIRSCHRQAKVVQYMDFVDENSKEKSDLSGHGSNSVDLDLKVYASADLYVARIFEQDTSDEESGPKMMAEGIIWAIENEVDIISISAGFEPGNGCPSVLRKAVDKATKAGILTFAAASNWSNKDGVAWPAAIQDQVICVYATDGGNRHIRQLNPDPRYQADNFAILGFDVEIDPNQKPVDGTSISTAIAAGLAGLLIDFGRQSICRGDDEVIDDELLTTKAGMSAVFRKMSIGMKEGYDCMMPWRILTSESVTKDASRAEKRTVVRKNLSSALRRAR
ncbi:hypothetical protein MMC30_007844 [Trapelia coarctata]|nr:hypothetical protein [Trapelia coarctata]